MRTLLAFLFLAAQAFGAFSYSRTLTIDHTKCGASNSSNFPVLVSISHSTLKTVANGGHIQHTATQTAPAVTMPADLIFSADSSGNTRYPWEVESYDGTNGILIAWVKIPTVTYAADTSLYMLYGDGTITTAQNVGSLAPANVWDANYQGVWHLPNGGTPSAFDSTANGNSGTVAGTAAATAGKIDGAQMLDGATDDSIPSSASLNITGNITIEAWVMTGLSGGATRAVFTGYQNGGAYPGYAMRVAGNGVFGFYSGNSGWADSSNEVNDNLFHHIAVSLSGTSVFLYRDGTLDAARTSAAPNAYSGVRYIGGDGMYFLPGTIDEVRVSNAARSADWILTEYNNQNAPGNVGADAFLKFGTESNLQPAGSRIRHRAMGGE